MKSKLQKLLTIILFGGSIFAWYTVFNDFSRFQRIYGTIFRIENCSVPNPVTTPCFYGAIAFVIALILSIKKNEKPLYILLIGGTIFAWSNFAYEVYKFYASTGVKTSCAGVITNNVFTTPCFYGACIYLLALITIKYYRTITD
jgi:hypothetical protein